MGADSRTQHDRQPLPGMTAGGKLISPTEEERAERSSRLREAVDQINAEPASQAEIDEDMAQLREIDDGRAARGLRKLWEGYS